MTLQLIFILRFSLFNPPCLKAFSTRDIKSKEGTLMASILESIIQL